MERFSYSEESDVSFQRHRLREHIKATKGEPVLGVISTPLNEDILEFSGQNHGVSEHDQNKITVLQGEDQQEYDHPLDETLLVLGVDEISDYLSHRLDGWQQDQPLKIEHITKVLDFLTAAKQLDITLPNIDITHELSTVWEKAVMLSMHSYDHERNIDFAYTCLDSELAPLLHTYALSRIQNIPSYTAIANDPLLSAYIETQIEGPETLENSLIVLQRLLDSAKALEKSDKT
jgi:hypothetical protein